MTNNEIIYALKRCSGWSKTCDKCAYKEVPFCSNQVKLDAVDLIKRQQTKIYELANKNIGLQYDLQLAKEELMTIIESQTAEIERLKDNKQIEVSERLEKEIRSEAIKEFAEKLKEKAVDVGICDAQGNSFGGATVVFVGDIDNLVKEMVGDTK